MKSIFIVIIALVSLQALAQSNKSNDKKLIVTELERFELVHQVKAMDGYNIRARKIIVPAGASIPEHAHDKRAGIVYVESGEVIEYRGEKSRRLSAGDSLVEDATTVHSYKNTSENECVLIAFDLPLIKDKK